MSGKLLEGCSIQLYEGLADDGLHLTGASLHVHHHRDGHTTGLPLVGRSRGVLHDSHVAGLASGDELGGTVAKGVAVVGIEVRRSGAASLVAEEVMLRGELALEDALLLHLLQLL